MKTVLRNATSREDGFTLIELLVVVFVIGAILAIAVPKLNRARRQAEAASAVQSLRTITTAQYQYENTARVYATLDILASEKIIDSKLGSGSKSGYSFTLALGVGNKSFICKATPFELSTALTHFFVDQTGVIRSNVGTSADANSHPIP